MKMKIILKNGQVKYYNGKNKYGEIMLVSGKEGAKEFSKKG